MKLICEKCSKRLAVYEGKCYPCLVKKRHKYGAEATVVDGIRFASKKEARRYQELLLAKQAGKLLFFLRQVPFQLPGGVRYVVDFAEFWKTGEVVFSDAKGYRTKDYILKKKMVEALYPITITEV